MGGCVILRRRGSKDSKIARISRVNVPFNGKRPNIAHRGHGDDGPPVGVEHGVELGAVLLGVLLDGEGERGEDEDAHRHEEEEQPQLLVAVLDGEAQALQAHRVARQLEDPGRRERNTFDIGEHPMK